MTDSRPEAQDFSFRNVFPRLAESGVGFSSSTVNVLWGFFNVVIGYLLLRHVGDFGWRNTGDVAAFGAGALLVELFCARHFGRFHGGNTPKSQ